MKIKLMTLTIITVFVSGCVTTPLKAPSDEYARGFCHKIKINQW